MPAPFAMLCMRSIHAELADVYCPADGVPATIDMLHTVRATIVTAVWLVRGARSPPRAEPAATSRWPEGQHGRQDQCAGQGW